MGDHMLNPAQRPRPYTAFESHQRVRLYAAGWKHGTQCPGKKMTDKCLLQGPMSVGCCMCRAQILWAMTRYIATPRILAICLKLLHDHDIQSVLESIALQAGMADACPKRRLSIRAEHTRPGPDGSGAKFLVRDPLRAPAVPLAIVASAARGPVLAAPGLPSILAGLRARERVPDGADAAAAPLCHRRGRRDFGAARGGRLRPNHHRRGCHWHLGSALCHEVARLTLDVRARRRREALASRSVHLVLHASLWVQPVEHVQL